MSTFPTLPTEVYERAVAGMMSLGEVQVLEKISSLAQLPPEDLLAEIRGFVPNVKTAAGPGGPGLPSPAPKGLRASMGLPDAGGGGAPGGAPAGGQGPGGAPPKQAPQPQAARPAPPAPPHQPQPPAAQPGGDDPFSQDASQGPGAEEAPPEQPEEAHGDPLEDILATLLALYQTYYAAHWKSRGPASYSDHLLFERLYGSVQSEFDGLSEKLVGMGGSEALDHAGLAVRVAELMQHFASGGDLISQGLAGEEMLQHLLEGLLGGGSLPQGLTNFLQGIADNHETNVYLLKQRQSPTPTDKTASAPGRLRAVMSVKEAYIHGARQPGAMDNSSIPYEHREAAWRDYLAQKGQEPPTSWGKAIGTGAAVGGGVGALSGLGTSSMLGRAGIGALLGGGIGGLLRAGDAAEIRRSGEAVKTPEGVRNSLNAHITDIDSGEKAQSLSDHWEQRRRHEETLEALRTKGAAAPGPSKDVSDILLQGAVTGLGANVLGGGPLLRGAGHGALGALAGAGLGSLAGDARTMQQGTVLGGALGGLVSAGKHRRETEHQRRMEVLHASGGKEAMNPNFNMGVLKDRLAARGKAPAMSGFGPGRGVADMSPGWNTTFETVNKTRAAGGNVLGSLLGAKKASAEKEALTPFDIGRGESALLGGGLGALAGAGIGAARAEKGERRSAALKGGLIGGGLGAVAGGGLSHALRQRSLVNDANAFTAAAHSYAPHDADTVIPPHMWSEGVSPSTGEGPVLGQMGRRSTYFRGIGSHRSTVRDFPASSLKETGELRRAPASPGEVASAMGKSQAAPFMDIESKSAAWGGQKEAAGVPNILGKMLGTVKKPLSPLPGAAQPFKPIDPLAFGKKAAWDGQKVKEVAGDALVRGGVGAGIATAGILAHRGISHLLDRATAGRDKRKLLETDPRMSQYDPAQIDLAFNSLRAFAPHLTKDPLAGANSLRTILQNRDPHDPSAPPRISGATVASELGSKIMPPPPMGEKMISDALLSGAQGAWRSSDDAAGAQVQDAMRRSFEDNVATPGKMRVEDHKDMLGRNKDKDLQRHQANASALYQELQAQGLSDDYINALLPHP